jgi:D-alanyl-lipoteichoic acid acyltransferase DltB (MBOAT superfamily)
MAPLADLSFGQPHDVTMPVAWLGVLGYSLQLYFDFSGYSDMAIGLARIFGIRFPLNFNSPYKATNIIDFWQRWHMTLTRYITAYLYNPAVMWATRRRLARGQKVSRAAQATPLGFSTMIALPMFYTMGLAGIWHGAGFQYLIFGLLHGLYLTANHAWRVFRAPVSASGAHATAAQSAWPVKVLCVLLTYAAVLVGQVFFRANSAGDALRLLAGMSGMHGLHLDQAVMDSLKGGSNVRVWTAYIAACFFIAWALPNSNEIVARYERLSLNPAFQGALYAAMIFIVVVGASGPPVTFLYFQF